MSGARYSTGHEKIHRAVQGQAGTGAGEPGPDRKVFAELHQEGYRGREVHGIQGIGRRVLCPHCSVALAGGESPITQLAAFKAFQAGIKERCESFRRTDLEEEAIGRTAPDAADHPRQRRRSCEPFSTGPSPSSPREGRPRRRSCSCRRSPLPGHTSWHGRRPAMQPRHRSPGRRCRFSLPPPGAPSLRERPGPTASAGICEGACAACAVAPASPSCGCLFQFWWTTMYGSYGGAWMPMRSSPVFVSI